MRLFMQATLAGFIHSEKNSSDNGQSHGEPYQAREQHQFKKREVAMLPIPQGGCVPAAKELSTHARTQTFRSMPHRAGPKNDHGAEHIS